MPCPYCTTPMAHRTTLGYRMFRCRACRRTSNERTGTLYNQLHVPTDIAVLVVLWRLQDKLGPRTRFNEAVSLAEQRRLFQEHWGDVCAAPDGLTTQAAGPPPGHRHLKHLCGLKPDTSCWRPSSQRCSGDSRPWLS